MPDKNDSRAAASSRLSCPLRHPPRHETEITTYSRSLLPINATRLSRHISVRAAVKLAGMTKYRKRPQRTTREHHNRKRRWSRSTWAPLNTAETAVETKYAAGPRRKSALAGSLSVRRGRPLHLWTWQLVWLAVFCLIWTKVLLARSNQHPLMATWQSCTVQMLERN